MNDYLSFDEYKAFGYGDMDEAKFNSLLTKASDVLNSLTNSFYEFHDLADDVNKFRVSHFKKALARQLDYMAVTGITSKADLINNPRPTSVTQSMGRTSVSKSFRTGNSAAQSDGASAEDLVADEVYSILYPTGLLYKGVDWR